MSEPFGSGYASLYDHVYAEKDYARECLVLREEFDRRGLAPVRSILDLGCGTGGHAIPLAGAGFDVTGVDRSEAMLSQARAKAREADVDVTWVHGDIRDLDIARRFDAVLMMFAVLGYQGDDGDVAATLTAAHNQLQTGGLLLFDVWHGPAVVATGPADRRRRVPVNDGAVSRVARGTLEPTARRVRIDISLVSDHGAVVHERHDVRYFFPEEIERFLDRAGFRSVAIQPFPYPDRPVGDESWSVLVTARAGDAGST